MWMRSGRRCCILRDGARAAALVERTRDLVKKRPRRRRPVEINAAIREAIELIRTEAEKNGVSVQTKLVETLPPLSGDPVELQQVVLNLIINAIEAMTGTSEAPRELLVSTDRTEAGGVLILLRDFGPSTNARHPGKPLQGFPHHQAERTWFGPVDLPFDRLTARWALGRAPTPCGAVFSIYVAIHFSEVRRFVEQGGSRAINPKTTLAQILARTRRGEVAR